MRVEIAGLAGGGRGVARADGRVWFVAGALPGEAVEAAIERERAGIVEARLVRVERAGAWREADPCPVADSCGGCDLAHVRRDATSEVLREVTCGALRHAEAELAEAVRRAPVTVSPMPWRLRARLHWDPVRGVLGFFGARSHTTVDISPCRVVSPALLGALPDLAGALLAAGAGAGELEWLEDLRGDTAVAGWRGGRIEVARLAGIAGWHRLEPMGEIAAGGWGEAGVTMRLPVPLWVPVGAFFQGNRHLVPRLFARIGELVRSFGLARVVDLYAGVGFLAAAARHSGAPTVIAIEPNRIAADAARANLPEAKVVHGTAEAFLSDASLGAHTVAILDPPRTGLSRAAADALLGWSPAAVIMLGCDVSRFGRDASTLIRHGYLLGSLELFDLFAGSHHVEILASFTRDGA